MDLSSHLERASEPLLSSGGGGSSLSDLFREEPVPLDVFVQDRRYLGNPPLGEPHQFDLVRHMERIYYPETFELMGEEFGGYWAEPVKNKNVFTCELGKGAGKDHIIRISALRVIYLLLCLRDPHEYFQLPMQDMFHILNVAGNSDLAKRAFFKPMVNAVRRGWFADYADPKAASIEFGDNIEAISGTSDGNTQDGLNLIFSVADEVDAFYEPDPRRNSGDKESSRSADTMIKMMRSSGASRFPRTFKHARISWPRYLGSRIQRYREEAELSIAERGDRSVHYMLGPLATWLVNPRFKNIPLIEVKGASEPIPDHEEFIEAFRDDPDDASAKYLCKPKKSSAAFFRNEHAVNSAFSQEEQPITITYELTDNGVWKPNFTIDPSLKPIAGAIYAIHADLAKTGDSAGVSMAHVSRMVERERVIDVAIGEKPMVEVEELPFVKSDFTISFTADKSEDPAREIQVWWVRKLVGELRRAGFVIATVTYDKYESLDSMQILETWGIESSRLSTDVSPAVYRNLRDVIYHGRVEAQFDQKLVDEILSLRELANGKIDHPPKGSKDMADAFACAIYGAIQLGGCEDDEGEVATFGQDSIGVGGYMPTPEGFSLGALAYESGTTDWG